MPDLDQIKQGEQAVSARCVCHIIPHLVEGGAEAFQDRIVGGCTAHRAFPMYRRQNTAARPIRECGAVACSPNQPLGKAP